MAYSFSPRALKNVDAIYNHIARDNPSAAQKVIDRIYTIAAYLAEYPNSGRATKLRNMRVVGAHPYPYLIYFHLLPSRREIRILRVRHAARRPLFFNEPSADFAHEIPRLGAR